MLLKNETTIIRVLKQKGNQSLIIDCIARTMPQWVDRTSLLNFIECDESELYQKTGAIQNRILNSHEQRIAQERYTLIAGVLPFIGDEPKRCMMINLISEHKSKQTIRKYLCLYLVYQDMAALAPKPKYKEGLTKDEKNMRWALNKFFYTQHKNSLATAYTMMLQAKYCDSYGQLTTKYPTINQFRYFYRKTKKLQDFYISRDGLKNYQRNNRPLLGDGVQHFAPAVGTGMLDSTICDIYLVDEGGKLIGRPVLTACVDAFSSLCMGYSLGWEGGTYSLRGLMLNVITPKVEWCQSHGVFINLDDWNSCKMPGVLVTDMGTEYKGDTFSQIVELGVKVVNLPPYRPELKGVVEKFFDILQGLYKKHLKGKGVVEPDANERGVHDYRLDACLTLKEFEQIILHCIVYYNSKRVIDYPFKEDMVSDGIKPYANQVFAWGENQMGANLIEMDSKKLILTLLPRTTGKFKRNGLQVNGLRYKHNDFTEAFLSGGEVTVAYNPDDVSECWIIKDSAYIPFTLIERRFDHKSLEDVKTLKKSRKQAIQDANSDNLQAQIDLAEHIQIISANRKPTDGNFITRSVEHTFPTFKVGYVYAYEDTNGKPLPSIVSIVDKEVSNYNAIMDALRKISPAPIRFDNIINGANGYYDLLKREIVIKESLPDAQKLKTAIHEVAHSLLHDKVDGLDVEATKREMEVSAESVAFVVSAWLGVDTSEYSYGYLSCFSATQELTELQRKMENQVHGK